MTVPTKREVMRWLAEVEDDPVRAPVLREGGSLLRAAAEEGFIGRGAEDGLALAILELHEAEMVQVSYPLLEADQGHEIFRGQPAHHLRRVDEVHSLSAGRDWVRDAPPPGHTVTISGSSIGQLALRDINNDLTLVSLVASLERAVDELAAAPGAKEEAKGWLRRFRTAVRGGGALAHETGVEVLAKVIAQALKLPPE